MGMNLNAEQVAARLGKSRRAGTGFMCCCPAHDDQNPSLFIRDGSDGKLITKCYANCSSESVRAALMSRGLWPEAGHSRSPNLRDAKKESKRRSDQIEHVVPVPATALEPNFLKLLGWQPTVLYKYPNAAGALVMLVARLDRIDGEKEIRPLSYVRNGLGQLEWIVSARPAPRALYGLNHLALNPSAPVLVVEGEKTAEAARQLFPDHAVVTWSGGANSVDKSDWSPLAGRDVVLWADNDEPGKKAMEAIAATLKTVARSVQFVQLPIELPKGWDLADTIPDGLSAAEILATAITIQTGLRKHIMTGTELLELPIPLREFLIREWLPRNGLAMIWAARGLGKTWYALTLAICIAEGVGFLGYEVSQAEYVLFIDGEMALSELQERVRLLHPGALERLLLLPSESLFRDGRPLNINDPEDQRRIKEAIDTLTREGRRPALIILDNLSSLTAGIDENDNSALDGIIRWMIGMRHEGLAVVFVHHANKAGDQRGASRREDQLDTSIRLSAPEKKEDGKPPHDGAHFIMEFTKTRGRKPKPLSIEMKLVQMPDGRMEWALSTGNRPLPRDEVLRFIAEHRPQLQDTIGEALHRSKGAISKDCTALERSGLIERHPLRVTKTGLDRLLTLWPELYAALAKQGDLPLDNSPI